MSAGEGQGAGEKEHAPSQKRLEDVRKRGEIPRSSELTAAAVLAAFLVATIIGASAISQAAVAGKSLLDQAPEFSRLMRYNSTPILGNIILIILGPFGIILVIPLIAVVFIIILQGGVVFSLDKINPKVSRISPFGNAKRKFAREGLMEFAKSFVKVLLLSFVLMRFLVNNAKDLILMLQLHPASGIVILLEVLANFLTIVALVTFALGALDLFWQRYSHLQRNRMSRKEMQDEARESDGDPHIKSQRRQRGQEIALNRMLLDVQKANVIIVNPTHYAVALKWQRGSRLAPIVVAKGVDDVARRIREKAIESGVPLHSDPPTARAIHSTVEIGHPVNREQFRAVATAIRFAEIIRSHSKQWKK